MVSEDGLLIQPPQPKRWQRWIQNLAARQQVTVLMSHILNNLDMLVLRISKGHWSVAGWLTGWPIIRLTSTGAKTQLPRTHPLIAVPCKEKIVLIASNFGRPHNPAWYYNLCAHPEATISLDGRSEKYLARETAGNERESYWRRAVEVYAGYQLYAQRAQNRVIPVMVLEPLPPD